MHYKFFNLLKNKDLKNNLTKLCEQIFLLRIHKKKLSNHFYF